MVIPDVVESIGDFAFSGCSGLTSVTIPDNVTNIGEGSFSHCSSLTFFTIPGSVTKIGYGAFEGCSGLTTVTILGSVTSIGNRTFRDCSSLTTVTIPGSVTSIGYMAFSDCSGLTSVIIPNSVTRIGDNAFSGCSGLISVTIGSGVKNIESQAFTKCPELTDVFCYAETVPSTATSAFDYSYIIHATLHVPTASIDAYKAKEPWKYFKSIMGLDGTTPEEPEVKKCATPTISIVDGELEFSCETEDVEYVSEITSKEVKKYYDSKVKISGTYTVSVYAMKTGWENSDVATLEFTVGADGTGVLGDVNGDGIVDVSDYIGVANIILTGTVDGKKE